MLVSVPRDSNVSAGGEGLLHPARAVLHLPKARPHCSRLPLLPQLEGELGEDLQEVEATEEEQGRNTGQQLVSQLRVPLFLSHNLRYEEDDPQKNPRAMNQFNIDDRHLLPTREDDEILLHKAGSLREANIVSLDLMDQHILEMIFSDNLN